jgi:hypothetical protein
MSEEQKEASLEESAFTNPSLVEHQEQPSRNEELARLVEQWNKLEGAELEQALSDYLQTVAIKSLADAGDRQAVSESMRREHLKLGAIGMVGSGETRTLHPDFLQRVDFYKLSADVLERNREQIDQNEQTLAGEIAKAKHDLLSYRDVLTGEQQEQALSATEQSANGDLYAKTLAREFVRGNAPTVEKAKWSVKGDFNRDMAQLPDHVRAAMSPYAASESWIYWDIAKQKYLSEHEPATEAERDTRKPYEDMGIEADPLEEVDGRFSGNATFVHQAIADRHLGWEIQQMTVRGIDMTWLTKQSPKALELLSASTKSDGQLSSYQYTELGRQATEAARYVRNYPPEG